MGDFHSPLREREVQRDLVFIVSITLKTQIYWFALKFLKDLLLPLFIKMDDIVNPYLNLEVFSLHSLMSHYSHRTAPHNFPCPTTSPPQT